MTQEKLQQTVKTVTHKVFTKRNGKIALSVLVIGAIAAGGGSWAMHQQHQARKAQRAAAVSQMVKAQADQQNITLLTEDQARAAAAKAVGKDESSLTFDQLALVDMDNGRHADRHKKDKHKEHKERLAGGQMQEGPDREAPPQAMPPAPPQNGQADQNRQNTPAAPAAEPADGQLPVQGAPVPPQPQAMRPFRPMYAVQATDGQVKYKILLDAVTGTVLDSRVD